MPRRKKSKGGIFIDADCDCDLIHMIIDLGTGPAYEVDMSVASAMAVRDQFDRAILRKAAHVPAHVDSPVPVVQTGHC